MKIVKFGTAALIAFVGCVLKVCMLIIGLFNFSIVTPAINTYAVFTNSCYSMLCKQ